MASHDQAGFCDPGDPGDLDCYVPNLGRQQAAVIATIREQVELAEEEAERICHTLERFATIYDDNMIKLMEE
jgi:hypothetical protein